MSAYQKTNLYRVNLEVRPKPTHPTYWDWQFGVLCVWLFAECPEEAGEKAGLIVSELPYEITASEGQVVSTTPSAKPLKETEKDQPDYYRFENIAKQTGLALCLLCCPTGTTEGDWLEGEW